MQNNIICKIDEDCTIKDCTDIENSDINISVKNLILERLKNDPDKDYTYFAVIYFNDYPINIFWYYLSDVSIINNKIFGRLILNHSSCSDSIDAIQVEYNNYLMSGIFINRKSILYNKYSGKYETMRNYIITKYKINIKTNKFKK
jgi:hypothetical protein